MVWPGFELGDHWLEGADESTELMRHPYKILFASKKPREL